MATLVVNELDLPLRSFRLELTLEVGSTVALVGPSGAGKSSLLRAIAGLAKPDGGTIGCDGDVWFDAQRRINLPPEQRRVGLVFQEYALFPHLTVRANVEYGRRHPADEYLERFRIAHLAALDAGALAGGERQRVAFLRRALRASRRCCCSTSPSAPTRTRRRRCAPSRRSCLPG